MSPKSFAVAGTAALLMGAAFMAGAFAQASKSIIGPSVYNLADYPVKDTATGKVQAIITGPTATIDRLEMHITTLNPGVASHPPHKHATEELVIIDTGTVETLVDGVWKKVTPGGIIFNASNVMHALRNIGDTPATYHVINITTDRTPKE